ncbi:MAG: hypothetical protein SGILL_002712 [Bacillariaceae sp.]
MTPAPHPSASSGGAGAGSGAGKKDNVVIIRPTEAQLRYSQFHHKRRAQAVKAWMEELYQTPPTIEEHDSNDNDDDDESDDCCSYNSSDTNTSAIKEIRRHRRPVISAGRRALLKKSRRMYRRRRRAILKDGYRGFVIVDGNDEVVAASEALSGSVSDSARNVVTRGGVTGTADQPSHDEDDGGGDDADYEEDAHDMEEEEDAPELQDIFMTRPKRQRQRHHPNVRTTQQRDGSDESYKRFQAACHAMMMNIKTSHVTTPVMAAPTKRWKRSEQHIKAAEELKHKDFLDYKWGVRKRDPNERTLLLSAYYQQQTHQLMDRGASWMMHSSKHVQYDRDSPYYHDMANLPPGSTASGGTGSDFTSSTLAMRAPGPKKFNKLVAFVQQRLIEKEKEAAMAASERVAGAGGAAPTMRLRDSHVSADDQVKEEKRTSRAKEMAESFESKAAAPNSDDNRIRLMAQALEGGDQTPTMTLKTGLEFGSSSSDKRQSLGSQQRRARYVPRMRLRDFSASSKISDDDHNMADGDDDPVQGASPRRHLVQKFDDLVDNNDPEEEREIGDETDLVSPPKMTLRHGMSSESEDNGESRRLSKTRETALAIEGKQNASHSGGKIKAMAQSFESDKTPKMKLRNDPVYEVDEKKVSEEDSLAYSQSTVHRLSEQFQGNDKTIGSPFGRPSIASSDYFAQVRDGADANGEQDGDDARASTSGRPSGDFFAAVREESDSNDTPRNSDESPLRRSSESRLPVQQLASPARESDAMSDLSRDSNLSGFWNRGRSSINALTTSLNTIAETHADKVPPELKERASNVSDRVSGFFGKLRNQTSDESAAVQDVERNESAGVHHSEHVEQNVDEQSEQDQRKEPEFSSAMNLLPSQSEDSHDALAAYRKKRETLSPDMDKDSDTSSYHALPNQIREVVQNAKASPALVTRDNERSERFISPTTSQSTTSQSTKSHISVEKFREVHGKIIENSTLLGEYEQDSVIDTDDVNSDVNGGGMDPQKLASLMMSPDVLQKRLKQAVQAVEKRNWEQVSYLINANPWLAEMKELTTNQFLLHKLAFFGGGSSPAPEDLCERLIEKFPSAVYKFDQDGNVPLHLASAAGNLFMIEMLGDRFESGASIRNEDGMLPLHFTIASLADFKINASSSSEDSANSHALSLKVVKTVLGFFPKAVAIADNVGNIPLHVAAECLERGIGVDVVYLLMDEAERQLNDPYGARFHNKVKLEEIVQEDMSAATMSTDKETESSIVDTELHCSMVLNNYDETPLLSAVKSRKGWEIVEAILTGPGGQSAALHQDADKNNALHLLVGDFQDPTAAMSILKLAPEAATARNAEGMLPIELACMQMMPEEVILGIALVDIPFNIDDQNGLRIHGGRGGSWYFLTCESDDHMIEIVQEVVSICSFQQLRELCFMTDVNSGNTVIERATPKCHEVLSQSLRFLGRFEFIGNGPLRSNPDTGFKAFDALDFGGEDLNEEGRRVLLECYDNEESFEMRVHTLLSVELDNSFVEEVNVYVEYMDDPLSASDKSAQRRCVSIERPQLTLDKVVSGMQKNGGYKNDLKLKMKYAAKVCSVLRLIGKALRHLHSLGIVHGNICMESCGKFSDGWKLLERLEVQMVGEGFDPLRFRNTFPPESLELSEQDGAIYDSDDAPVSFVKNMTAQPAIDVWAFGQICYEALVGKPLVEFDQAKSPSDDVAALLQIMEWNQSNMQTVFSDLLESGIEESGADLITSCLFPDPGDRPSSMEEILDHTFWMDMRKHRLKKGTGRGIESMGSSVSQPTEPETYEV